MTAAVVLFFVVYLIMERWSLSSKISNIPLRVAVTGTRGKSSVTRLIAACLRESGMSVLAKTTGSRPSVIYPDGSEIEIERRGPPSILEGKKILKESSKRKVQALVTELMSIRCESLYTEAVQILKPHILVFTNIRADHLAEIGFTKKEMIRCFASGIPQNCTVFIPIEESGSAFQRKAEKVHSKIVQVSQDSLTGQGPFKAVLPAYEFDQNMRLALAVTEFLGINQDIAFRAMARSRPDFGSLKIWEAEYGYPPLKGYFVSAFAANDPESTTLILKKLERGRLFEGRKKTGLLNLRSDRGDRTIQWLKAFTDEDRPFFHRIFLIGPHAPVLKKRLKRQAGVDSTVLKADDPKDLMAQIAREERKETVLVGMGNMGGMGETLVRYWEEVGSRHDL